MLWGTVELPSLIRKKEDSNCLGSEGIFGNKWKVHGAYLCIQLSICVEIFFLGSVEFGNEWQRSI